MIEAQNLTLAQAAAIDSQHELAGPQPVILRNSRILLGLTYLGSAAALVVCLATAALAFTSIFPIRALNFDRASVAFLCSVGAWLMALSNVYLWRQARGLAHCSVLLDTTGAHFTLGVKNLLSQSFIPWNGIEAVRYKRIPNAFKFTILGKDTSTITICSCGSNGLFGERRRSILCN